MGVIDRRAIRHINRPGKYDVCEVFSQPRVVPVAEERGLRAGWSLDVKSVDKTTGRSWNLLDPVQREMAFDLVRRDKPHTVILSPPCTKFCALLRLCKNGVDRKDWIEAVRMVNAAVKIAEIQLDAGRHFVFEHPLTASSWRLPSLKRLRQRAGVCETVLHQCMYGLTSKDADGVAPAKKPTRILCSSIAVRDMLSLKCDGSHRHVQLISGRAAAAQEYPPDLCSAIVDGVELEILASGQRACNSQSGNGHWREAHAADQLLSIREEDTGLEWEQVGDDEHVAAGDTCEAHFVPVDGEYVDDITGLPLDPALVHKGRLGEMQGFDSRGVYAVRTRSWAKANGIPILGNRWVDRMKGDVVRSRLVAQDFNHSKGKQGPDELFAATPPLVAARFVTSRCASSVSLPRRLRRQLMTLDFEKAFLNGLMVRDVCIELPSEDGRGQGGKFVGHLRKAMYGLREAPVIWQDVVRELMSDLGFAACRTMPSVYYHREWDVCVVAHVDDFLSCGPKDSLLKLKEQLLERFSCSGDILGEGEDEVKELSFLGRKITLTDEGLEWRGDRRQVQTYLKRAKLEESSPVDTPGVKHSGEEPTELMSSGDATQHRSLVALANFISQDRVDVGFATKALSQTMANPRVGDEAGVKRLGRYFRKYPSAVLKFGWQADPSGVTAYSDSDWGGCEKTRRSTTGGVLLHGKHLLGFWSRTQQTVSLSSCEAEINALIKSGVEGLGLRNLVRHCGSEKAELKLHTDASAAVGVCRRLGAGKQKHLSIKQMWAQEKVDRGDFDIAKVPRESNVSDVLTHHPTNAELEKFMGILGVRRDSR